MNFSQIKNKSIIKRTWHQITIYNSNYDSPEMQNLFNNPDIGLQDRLLKHDTSVKIDSTTVGLISIAGKSFVVKRYNIKGFFHALKKCLWRTRAKKCWLNAHRLLCNGFFTPTPVAMIEKRFGPFRKKSYYIYEYINGTTIKDLLYQHPDPNIIELLILTLKLFCKNKIYHGDMKLLNFLIDKDKLIILDLDSMQFYKSKTLFNFTSHKDSKHLITVNFQDNPELLSIISNRLHQAKLL